MENVVPLNASEQTPKPKKSWWKKILWFFFYVFLFFFVLIAALPLYSTALFSGFVVSAGDAMGFQTKFDSLSVNLLTSNIGIRKFNVKQPNSTEDLLRVDEINVDYSLLQSMQGAYVIPNIEVSGVYARIEIDETKTHVTIDTEPKPHISQPTTPIQPTPVEPAPKKKLEKLPQVYTHIKLSNVNLLVINKVTQRQSQITNFNWEANVQGLENIQYSSKWEQARFEGGTIQKMVFGLIYNLQGQLSLAMKQGQLISKASGKLTLSNMQSQVGDQPLMRYNDVAVEHDLDIDMSQGMVTVKKLGCYSDYLTLAAEDLEIRNLLELQSLIEQMSQAKTRAELQTLVAKIPTSAWKGKFKLSASLDKLYRDFGQMIAEKSQGKLEKFGGEILISAVLQGQPNGIQFAEDCKIQQLRASGKYPRPDGTMRPYQVSLDMDQSMNTSADFANRSAQVQSFLRIQPSGQTVPLLEAKQQSAITNIASWEDWNIQDYDNSFLFSFDVLATLIKDFLPEGTQIRGKIANQDSIKTIKPLELECKGKTEVLLGITTPKIQGLPDLQIQGERDIWVGLDEHKFPCKFQVKKMTLSSIKSKLLKLEATGSVDLKGTQSPSLNMLLAIQLKELQPYLEPFIEGIQIAGEFQHRLQSSEKAGKIAMQNQGMLDGLMVQLPNMAGPINPFQLPKIEWDSQINLTMQKDPTGNALVIHPSHWQFLQNKQPWIRCDLQGSLSKKELEQSSDLNFTAKVYGKQIQTLIPPQTIRDADFKKFLTQDLTLDGYADFVMNLKASKSLDQGSMELSTSLDLTPFVAKLQHAELGPIIDKTAQTPMLMKSSVTARHALKAMELLLKSAEITVGSVKIPIGSVLIQKDTLGQPHITGPDGQSPATVINQDPFLLSELYPVFPVLKQLKLDKATLEMRLNQLLVHGQDAQGKCKLHLIAPQLDLKTIREVRGKTGREGIVQKVKEDPRQVLENRPLMVLTQKMRDTLKNIGLDFEIQLDQVILDRRNQGENLKVAFYFNKDQPDNKGKLSITGKIGQGTINIQGVADLDRDHPYWTVDYDMQRVPYVVEVFGPVTDRISEFCPIPLLDKIAFKDSAELQFGLKGSNRWYGMDPRGIKKSVVSGDEMVFELPSGKFDLGYDFGRFLDIASVRAEVEKRIAPIQAAITGLRSQESGIQAQNAQLEAKVKGIREKIETIRGQRQPLMDALEKLKLAAKWQPALQSKLKEAQDKLKAFDAQITEQEKQQTQALENLQKQQGMLGQLQQKIKDEEAKIAQLQKDAGSQANLENPFAFTFDKIQIVMKVANDEPWAGVGGLDILEKHPFSRVSYVKVVFQPMEQAFPIVTGEFSLDGKYRFNFMPTGEALQKLDKLPGLRKMIEERQGIHWGSEGFLDK